MFFRNPLMADGKYTISKGYGPAMDAASHEKTYKGFVEFVEIATVVVACWILALAVGGIHHAWISAVIGVVLSAIAGAVGALIPALGIRAPAVVALALTLMLVFY